MPRHLFVDGRLLVGAYDLSGDANRVGITLDRAQLDRTTFADKKNQIFQPGLKIPSIDAAGFWRAGAEAGTTPKRVDDLLHGNLDLVDVPTTLLVEDAAGKPGYSLRTSQARYRPGPGQNGALIPFEVAVVASSGPFLRGHALHVGQVVADGQGAAFNLGDVPAGKKLYAVLHVYGIGQVGETLDVKVQSDDTNGFLSPVDRVVFGQKNSFAHEWAAAVDGPIADTWFRVSHDLGLAAVSFDYCVLVAIQ